MVTQEMSKINLAVEIILSPTFLTWITDLTIVHCFVAHQLDPWILGLRVIEELAGVQPTPSDVWGPMNLDIRNVTSNSSSRRTITGPAKRN